MKKTLTAAALACALSVAAPGIASASDATPVADSNSVSVSAYAYSFGDSDGNSSSFTRCTVNGAEVPCEDNGVTVGDAPAYEAPQRPSWNRGFTFRAPAFNFGR